MISEGGRLLVPIDFKAPEILESDKFRLRPLMIRDVIKDYDAVMTSLDHIRGLFGNLDPWPLPLPTFEKYFVTFEDLDGNIGQLIGDK